MLGLRTNSQMCEMVSCCQAKLRAWRQTSIELTPIPSSWVNSVEVHSGRCSVRLAQTAKVDWTSESPLKECTVTDFIFTLFEEPLNSSGWSNIDNYLVYATQRVVCGPVKSTEEDTDGDADLLLEMIQIQDILWTFLQRYVQGLVGAGIDFKALEARMLASVLPPEELEMPKEFKTELEQKAFRCAREAHSIKSAEEEKTDTLKLKCIVKYLISFPVYQVRVSLSFFVGLMLHRCLTM